jgi:P-type Cu+ transporter
MRTNYTITYISSSERLANEGKTPMYVAIDGTAAGLVAVADRGRPEPH